MSTEQMQEAVSAFDKLEMLGLLSPDGDFASFWSGWKASRAALVVTLPASPYMPESDPATMTDYERGEAQGRCDMWALARAALESAGIPVKP